MPIRLLACDLDGTLAARNGDISDASLAAIQRARQAGILFVLATGRLPFVLRNFLDRLQVTDEPIITAQGALIGYRDGRILRRLTLPPEIAVRAAELAGRHGAGMAYFTEDVILFDHYAFPVAQYQNWFGEHARFDPDAHTKLDGALIKFMAIHPDPAVVPTLLDELRTELGQQAEVTRSWDWFVEGTAPGADKGTALAWLCARLGLAPDEVLAVGDGGNDVSHAALGWPQRRARRRRRRRSGRRRVDRSTPGRASCSGGAGALPGLVVSDPGIQVGFGAARLGASCLTRQLIHTFVLGVPGVTLHPVPIHVMRRQRLQERLPQILILHRLAVRGSPAVALPGTNPLGDAQAQVFRIRMDIDLTGSAERL